MGQFIDFAYLLETKLVPEDSKSYEFACSNSANPNRCSLTASKPSGVYIEIVALKWLDQCLPMVQYSADINDSAGKFPFGTTYNYDIKFRLRCQVNPALPWNEIDNRLWSKCFAGGVTDSNFPVLIFIPLPMQQIKTIKHAGISTMVHVPSPFVSSNMNAVNVSHQDIAKGSAEDSNVICSHGQLNPQTFKPVTPIKVNKFEELLKGHPNQDLVHYVITGFRQGFLLKY